MNIHIIQNDFWTLNAFKLYQAHISVPLLHYTCHSSIAHKSAPETFFVHINAHKNGRRYSLAPFYERLKLPRFFSSYTQTEQKRNPSESAAIVYMI